MKRLVWSEFGPEGGQEHSACSSCREAAVDDKEQELAAREQGLQELRQELAVEHAAVLEALPSLQAR